MPCVRECRRKVRREPTARFPRRAGELPPAAVRYVASQVKVDPTLLEDYAWSGSTIEYHRAQIRASLGFRESTRDDEERFTAWLATDICPTELTDEGLRTALLARCRAERIEPPGRVTRIVAAARSRFEKAFCAEVVARLSPDAVARLEELITEHTLGTADDGTDAPTDAAPGDDSAGTDTAEGDPAGAGPVAGGGRGFFAELKADPGRLGLETLLEEITKLSRVRAIGLPADLFGGYSERLVAALRARAAASYPSDLQANPRPVRLTLLAALSWTRTSEITDALVDLLIGLVLKINTRAERKVEKAVFADLKRVHGKTGILFRVAEAAVEHPDDTVREAVYPVVGEKTLRELVAEAKANESVFRAQVRTVLTSSYTQHYRRMLPVLLGALEFKCNNTAYRPVMDAVDLLARYAPVSNRIKHFAHADRVPIQGVVPAPWRDAVVDDRGLVERVPYELCVLVALRDALRRREVYVAAAGRWRNPEEDLPTDFEDNRDVHYEKMRQPVDAKEFVAGLQTRMRDGLASLTAGLAAGTTGGVSLGVRRGEGWWKVPELGKLPVPKNLEALHAEVARRWGTIDLLDFLKEADHHTGFTDEFTSVATREATPRPVIRKRLMLALHGLGTNIGIKRVATAGVHGETEATLRTTRRLYVNQTTCAAHWAGCWRPPWPRGTRRGGAKAPRARRTPRSSDRGRAIS